MAENSGDTNENFVNIVNFTEGNGLRLNANALAGVLCQPDLEDKPLVVVGIAGALRTGKSFALSFLMRYLRNNGWKNPSWIGGEETCADDEIAWKYGSEPDTKGILISQETFTVERENGEKVAVLLVDTQGLFDSSMTNEENVKLFALTVLLCSFLMLNVKEKIDERELESLELFTEYSKSVAKDNGRETPFQDLMFLVRDWPYPDEIKYGTDGGESYLEKKVLRDTGREQLNVVRRNLRSAFSHVSCFLMPYPGDCVRRSDFVGKNSEIHKDFLIHVQELAKTVFDPSRLDERTYNGRPLTGRLLWSLLQACDSSFQANRVPQIDNITVTVAKTNNRQACEECVELFEEKMKSLEGGDGNLDDQYREALNQSLERYKELTKFGGEELRKEHRTRLISKCQEYFKTISAWDELRKIRARNMSSQKIHELWSSYKDSMRQGMSDSYQLPDSLEKMHTEQADLARNEYQMEAGLQAAFDEGHRTVLEDGINYEYRRCKALNEERSMLETLGNQEDMSSEYEAYLLYHQIAQQYRGDLEQFSEVYIDEDKLQAQIQQLQSTYLDIFEANWRREGPNIDDYRETIVKVFHEEYEECMKQNERNERVFMDVLEESAVKMKARYREIMHVIVKRSYCETEVLKKAHDAAVEELRDSLRGEISEVDGAIQENVLNEATGALDALYPEFQRINDGNKNVEPPMNWNAIKQKLSLASGAAGTIGSATITIRRYVSIFKSAKSALTAARPFVSSTLLPAADSLAVVLPYVALSVVAVGIVTVVAYRVYKHFEKRNIERHLQ